MTREDERELFEVEQARKAADNIGQVYWAARARYDRLRDASHKKWMAYADAAIAAAQNAERRDFWSV